MKIKFHLVLFISIGFFLCAASGVWAESNGRAVIADGLNKVIPRTVQEISHHAPEWVKRTDFTLQFQEDLKPLWSFETVQPLYRTPTTYRHTIFTQDRFAHTTLDDTINIGIGYRLLSEKGYWLLGANYFWDHTFERNHNRFGIGAEIIGQFAALRGNYYEAFSDHRFFTESSGARVMEKALDGWDVEGQIQVPYLPWANATFKGYGWQGISSEDIEGYQLSFLLNITKNIVLEFGRSDDDSKEENFLSVSFTIGGPERVEFTLVDNLFMKTFFTKRDLRKQTLAKIRRNPDIVVERIRQDGPPTGGVNIFIGRGT